jgi:hypothetical protein
MKHATRSITQGLGDAVPARAGREPSPFHVSALAGDHRLSRLVPTFTCRTLKPPHMRGHRQWLKLEGR